MTGGHSGWAVGVDLGTGSCKSVVIDTRAQVLGFASAEYAAPDQTAKWKEQSPESLVDAMLRSVRTAIDQADPSPTHCLGISLGGALHSLIALDRSDRPITGIMTWVDARANEQALAVRKRPDASEIYARTGCPIHTMYPLYKLIWLRERQPALFKQAARFVSAKEYVTHRLTGQFRVDPNIAAGSGLLDAHLQKWHRPALELAGISEKQLSALAAPLTVLPQISQDLAAKMGIPADTPLVLGSSDAVNSNLGAGAVRPEIATCMIGTSGAFRIIARRPLLDTEARSWCYAIDKGHWLVGGAINNGGIVLSWFRDLLNKALADSNCQQELSFDNLIQMAAQIAPGANGLICLPFFAGERSPHWNMDSRGVFFGLTLEHDTRHMVRALLEGVAFRLKSLAAVLADLGCGIEQIRLSGGMTHSDVWSGIVASALGSKMQVPQWGETSSLGAALWVLMAADAIDGMAEVEALIPLAQTYKPDQKQTVVYDRLFTLYQSLYGALVPCFEQMSRLQGE